MTAKFFAVLSLATLGFWANRSAARAHDDAAHLAPARAAVAAPSPQRIEEPPAGAASAASQADDAVPLSLCSNCTTTYNSCVERCDGDPVCECLCHNHLCLCQTTNCPQHCFVQSC